MAGFHIFRTVPGDFEADGSWPCLLPGLRKMHVSVSQFAVYKNNKTFASRWPAPMAATSQAGLLCLGRKEVTTSEPWTI